MDQLINSCINVVVTYSLNFFPKEYRTRQMYFMDDGAFHQSLESLVDYHSRFEDGLPVRLKANGNSGYCLFHSFSLELSVVLKLIHCYFSMFSSFSSLRQRLNDLNVSIALP